MLTWVLAVALQVAVSDPSTAKRCMFPEKFWWDALRCVACVRERNLTFCFRLAPARSAACLLACLLVCWLAVCTNAWHHVASVNKQDSHWAQLRLIRFFFPVAGSMMLCGRASFLRSGPRQLGVSLAGSRARFGGIEVLATGEDTLDSADGVCGG